ncbi:hypothetical protein OA92_13855 [Marinomonas sp. SBI22]|uniref:hypothetical protein n=1 Tax=unclassified Marinomonas TaxID=196814 RepID=UPI0007AF0470|nr:MULTISPECIES: hypothetical protein [unclassified Marinomonas]KZM41485.1 hypothetical protein OA92_13855 [Marinomonas sp. SBI22]KZM43321.1 hypothetical protein OA91_12060 [Marinomonas sp. SBI8L]
MKPLISANAFAGYLMFELAVSFAVLLILMQLLLPVLSNVRQQTNTKLRLLSRIELEAAVIDHFQSQLAPMFWRACGNASDLTFTIGAADQTLPERIDNKSVLAQSDWLNATHIGTCAYPVEVSNLSQTINYGCEWADEIIFSNCDMSSQGVVERVGDISTDVKFYDSDVIGRSGFVLSKQAFIWYLAPGKLEDAFWHTPEASGNSLELWSGVRYLSFYPLLDIDSDGTFDTMTTNYGTYFVSQLKGLWIELIVKEKTCTQAEKEIEQEFMNYRGEVWRFFPKCEFIIRFVVS